jgi:hypothetical protein
MPKQNNYRQTKKDTDRGESLFAAESLILQFVYTTNPCGVSHYFPVFAKVSTDKKPFKKIDSQFSNFEIFER